MAKTVPVGYVDFVMNMTREGDDRPYAITFGAKVLTPPFDETNLTAIALMAAEHLDAAMLDTDTLTKITAYVANDGPPFIYEADIDTEGTNVGNPLPQNTAAIITKSTGLGGRWNKGRMFWPSLIEAQVGPTGVLVSGYITNLDSYFNSFMGDTVDPLGDANLEYWVVFHDETLEIPPTQVIGLTTESVVGTQRRRLRR